MTASTSDQLFSRIGRTAAAGGTEADLAQLARRLLIAETAELTGRHVTAVSVHYDGDTVTPLTAHTDAGHDLTLDARQRTHLAVACIWLERMWEAAGLADGGEVTIGPRQDAAGPDDHRHA